MDSQRIFILVKPDGVERGLVERHARLFEGVNRVDGKGALLLRRAVGLDGLLRGAGRLLRRSRLGPLIGGPVAAGSRRRARGAVCGRLPGAGIRGGSADLGMAGHECEKKGGGRGDAVGEGQPLRSADAGAGPGVENEVGHAVNEGLVPGRGLHSGAQDVSVPVARAEGPAKRDSKMLVFGHRDGESRDLARRAHAEAEGLHELLEGRS